MLRELLGLFSIMVGITVLVIAIVATGWWAVLPLAGAGLVVGGLAASLRRRDETETRE